MKKKMVMMVMMTVLAVGVLGGCAQKGICERCGKKAVLYRFTTTSGLLGVNQTNTSKLCEDCLDNAIRAIDEDQFGITTYTYEQIQ